MLDESQKQLRSQGSLCRSSVLSQRAGSCFLGLNAFYCLDQRNLLFERNPKQNANKWKTMRNTHLSSFLLSIKLVSRKQLFQNIALLNTGQTAVTPPWLTRSPWSATASPQTEPLLQHHECHSVSNPQHICATAADLQAHPPGQPQQRQRSSKPSS